MVSAEPGVQVISNVTVVDGKRIIDSTLSVSSALSNSDILAQFYAYDPKFQGGVYVATADFNGDGWLDIAFAPGGARNAIVNAIAVERAGRGYTFGDVPPTYPAWQSIEKLYAATPGPDVTNL